MNSQLIFPWCFLTEAEVYLLAIKAYFAESNCPQQLPSTTLLTELEKLRNSPGVPKIILKIINNSNK